MATNDLLQAILQKYLNNWQIQLQSWLSGKPLDPATEALAPETVSPYFDSRLVSGEWSDIPKIGLLSESDMGGEIGAWAPSTQTTNPKFNWLSGASNKQTLGTLTDEFGRYLDLQFNQADTRGYEGESFGRILKGEELSSQTFEMINISYPEVESSAKTATGSILESQSSLLTTQDFSSTIVDSTQPLMRCGCADCMQKTSPNNVVTLGASETWAALPDDNPYINGLMTGSKWGDVDPDSNVTLSLDYYFYDDESAIDGSYGYAPYLEENAAAVNAMNAYSSVANITFNQVNNAIDADIKWASLDDIDSQGALGYAYTPESGSYSGLTTVNWEQYFDGDSIPEGSIDPGSYYYLTFTHELGHALGLKHPHDPDNPYDVFPGVSNSQDGGDNGLNAGPWTVMTYNDVTANNGYSPTNFSYSGFLEGLGAFDIAAAQYLYGANMNANTGNDIYKFDSLNGFYCIWDNGGTDLIDASNIAKSVVIDLRNATLENSFGGGGFVSQINNEYNGYTIAYNSTGSCIIENARGGSAADTLIGNSAANVLNGENGDDTLNGDAGRDELIGGGGKDQLNGSTGNDTLKGDAGRDKLIGGGGRDRLIGGGGGDKLIGGGGNDILNGGGAKDKLTGGGGKDKLRGGSNVDTFIYQSTADSAKGSSTRDVITDFKGSIGEKIDLSAIDAYTDSTGNQAFTYIGSNSFTGTQGEVRFSGSVLQMNTGTDTVADMEIELTGVTSFNQNSLIL